MAKPFPDSSATFACLTICTAKRSCGKPEPEKIGNFCPRINVARQSIDEIPVLCSYVDKHGLLDLMVNH